MAYVLPKYRGLGISPILWATSEYCAQNTSSLFSTLGTYPGFDSQVNKTNKGKFLSLGYIPFRSLNFNPYSLTEKSVFDGIESGMNLIVPRKSFKSRCGYSHFDMGMFSKDYNIKPRFYFQSCHKLK